LRTAGCRPQPGIGRFNVEPAARTMTGMLIGR
jgi:hypothetical protein